MGDFKMQGPFTRTTTQRKFILVDPAAAGERGER